MELFFEYIVRQQAATQKRQCQMNVLARAHWAGLKDLLLITLTAPRGATSVAGA